MVRRKIKFCIILASIIFIIVLMNKLIVYFGPSPYETPNYHKHRQHVPWYLTQSQLLMTETSKFTPMFVKHILWPNPPKWEIPHLQSVNLFSTCSVKNCEVHLGSMSEHKHYMMNAIVYSAVSRDQPFPIHPRLPDQIWLFFSMEAPYLSYLDTWKAEHWKNQINLTMTYRLDSDIVTNYGNVNRKQKYPSIHYFKDVASLKTKLIACVVSNCRTHSHRETYVNELAKYVPVDIFGGCGPNGRIQDLNLFNRIEMDYKFYLSFENALCLDYVTEKFFNIQDRNLVAIVRGGADYAQFYPPDTFINVDDFNSPEDLANYLLYLDTETDIYQGYLYRKAKFQSVPGNVYFSMCELCTKLHNPNIQHTIYKDIYKWFAEDVCYQSKIPLSL